jgi:hypothetical protein
LRLGLFALSCLAAGGCIFDPPRRDIIPPPPPKVELDFPENTLKDLEYAYATRDSLEIKGIYDSTYVGTSTDLRDPPESQILTFSYVDEVEHVAALARSSTITSVELDFGTVTRLPSDDLSHPEWAVIQIPGSNVRLNIYDTPDQTTLYATGEIFRFKFMPITPANTPTDTLWRIVRWEEIHQ